MQIGTDFTKHTLIGLGVMNREKKRRGSAFS